MVSERHSRSCLMVMWVLWVLNRWVHGGRGPSRSFMERYAWRSAEYRQIVSPTLIGTPSPFGARASRGLPRISSVLSFPLVSCPLVNGPTVVCRSIARGVAPVPLVPSEFSRPRFSPTPPTAGRGTLNAAGSARERVRAVRAGGVKRVVRESGRDSRVQRKCVRVSPRIYLEAHPVPQTAARPDAAEGGALEGSTRPTRLCSAHRAGPEVRVPPRRPALVCPPRLALVKGYHLA